MAPYSALAIVIVVLSVCVSKNDSKDCESDRVLYSKLCIKPPKEILNSSLSLEMFNKLEPEGGYRIFTGDELNRLRFGQILKGTPLTYEDDYDNMCFKIHGGVKDTETGGATGNFTGFGVDRVLTWRCTHSLDIPQRAFCNFINDLTQFEDNFSFYFVDTDREGVYVPVQCHEDGRVGWHSMTLTNKFTDEDVQAVSKKIVEMGFSDVDVVKMFDESKCT